MGAFFLLVLLTCGMFGGLTCAAFDRLLNSLILWHMRPIMDLLVETEELAERADDQGVDKKNLFFGADLAESLGVKFFVGREIPETLRAFPPGLHRLGGSRRGAFALIRRHDGENYLLLGKVRDFKQLDRSIIRMVALCIAASLGAAVLLALLLSRRLVTPLLELSRRVESGTLLQDSPLRRRKDEVGFLARVFADRERNLRNFLAREQVFTGDVSHELRTPLTVLQGGLEILESRAEAGRSLEPGMARPVLERMHRTLSAMSETVDTLLLLSRRPEQLEQVELDMTALARREAERLESTLPADRSVALRQQIEDGIHIRGNAGLAAVILRNLLENARLYTEAGHIILSLTHDRLSVTNTAPPLPTDVLNRMFTRGERGADAVPGSGLGLALVRRACEHMGWTVDYTQPEQPSGAARNGNCFIVRFNAACFPHSLTGRLE